jgi:hypothetical protein
LRLALFALVAGVSVSSLTLMFPVAAYYDAADLSESRFDVEIDGLITGEVRAAVETFAEPDSTIAFVVLNPAIIKMGGRSADPAVVAFTATPERLDLSWFPDSTVVAGDAAVPAGSWIDLSADAARSLGAQPGSVVAVPILGGEASFTVRRVLATARFGFRVVAAGPLTPAVEGLLGKAEFGTTPTALLFQTTAPVADVQAALAAIADGGKLQVKSREMWLAESASDPLLSAPVQLVGTLLGLAILAGLALREGQSLVFRRRHSFTVLVALGAPRSHVIAAALVGEATAVFGGLLAAWFITTMVAYRFVFAAALPRAFALPLAGALAFSGALYLATVAIAAARRLRRHDLYATLTAPA